MTSTLADPETVIPSPEETQTAEDSSRQIARLLALFQGNPKQPPKVEVRFSTDGEEELVLIPLSAFRLLNAILTEMSKGNAVTFIPHHAELTTQEAADYLNVSRPFLIGLLEAGKLKYRKVGTHRRIKFEDVVNCKRAMQAESDSAMEELQKEAQELDMGY